MPLVRWPARSEVCSELPLWTGWMERQVSLTGDGSVSHPLSSGIHPFGELPANENCVVIIEGAATIPVAVVAMFVVPDYPATTKWLSDEERTIAVLRIAEEANEEDDRAETPGMVGLKMAFMDPALYLIWFMQLGLNTAAGEITFATAPLFGLGRASSD